MKFTAVIVEETATISGPAVMFWPLLEDALGVYVEVMHRAESKDSERLHAADGVVD